MLTARIYRGGRFDAAQPRTLRPMTKPQRSILRSVGAVLAGLVVVLIITTATDAIMHATGIFPPWGQPMSDSLFVLAFAYRIVYGIAGGYVTARLAPDRKSTRLNSH